MKKITLLFIVHGTETLIDCLETTIMYDALKIAFKQTGYRERYSSYLGGGNYTWQIIYKDHTIDTSFPINEIIDLNKDIHPAIWVSARASGFNVPEPNNLKS